MEAESARMNRRTVLAAGMAAAPVAAVAWVVPEILTAKSAGGATLSSPAVGAPGGALGPPALTAGPEETPVQPHATQANGSLPFTGDNIEQQAAIGGALVAGGAALVGGGWVMNHWTPRTPEAGS